MRTRPLHDVAALLARIGTGAVLIAHGWRKMQVGITATGHEYHQMGVPAATPAAVYSTIVELLAGAALIVGIGLPIAGILLFIDMLGALIFVTGRHGIYLIDGGHIRNGSELVIVLGLTSLLFAAGGGGRFTLDQRLFKQNPPSFTTPTPASTRPSPPPFTGDPPSAAVTTTTSRDILVAKPPSRPKPEAPKPGSES